MRKTILLTSLLLMSGCATPKYNGIMEITAAHQKGAADAVNGSHYRDGGNESEIFLRELMRYVNQLEYELERPR